MKTKKHTESAGRCRVEYPLFSEAPDVSLMNSFSKKLASCLISKGGAAPGLKFSLTYAVSEYGGKVDVLFRFSSLRPSGRRTETMRIIWKDGYIIKFEKS